MFPVIPCCTGCPPLPADLEYRLVDYYLVLWDAHADLILDVLPDAIPRPSS